MHPDKYMEHTEDCSGVNLRNGNRAMTSSTCMGTPRLDLNQSAGNMVCSQQKVRAWASGLVCTPIWPHKYSEHSVYLQPQQGAALSG